MARQRLLELAVPHLCVHKPGGTTGEKDRPSNPGLQCWKITPQTSVCKNLWGPRWWEKLPTSQEFIGETHRVPESTQNHSPGNWHQKGPICLWEAGEVSEIWLSAKEAALFPLGPLPHIQCHNAATWVASLWQIPKAPPLTM